jgi:hypothetical protein
VLIPPSAYRGQNSAYTTTKKIVLFCLVITLILAKKSSKKIDFGTKKVDFGENIQGK